MIKLDICVRKPFIVTWPLAHNPYNSRTCNINEIYLGASNYFSLFSIVTLPIN
jgi:hypothetical protein